MVKSEDRCLIDGCQMLIACSICGGCEEQHKYNLMYGNCEDNILIDDKEVK
jgi:hypothetical protein